MKQRQHLPTLVTLCVSLLAVSACGGLRSGASPANPEAAPIKAARTLATPQPGGRTAEGGFVDGVSFAEKPGDVTINPVSFSNGAAHATGVIEPRHGSTWGGIALTTSLSRGSGTLDAASASTLAITLASTGSGVLRVRLVGPNTELRNTGCYPVKTVRVDPELKEYTVPIASFHPESYCGPNAPAGVVAAATLTAVEVADATITPGRRRQVDFTVGVIRLLP